MNLRPRVFHRSELPKTCTKELNEESNLLLIMDEVQIAAQKDQTIYNTFNQCDLLNETNLYKRDIKIIVFTATPDGAIFDLRLWGPEASTSILAKEGQGYMDAHSMLKKGRVFKLKDLRGYDATLDIVSIEAIQNIEEIRRHLTARYGNTPHYHIIRAKACEPHEKQTHIHPKTSF